MNRWSESGPLLDVWPVRWRSGFRPEQRYILPKALARKPNIRIFSARSGALGPPAGGASESHVRSVAHVCTVPMTAHKLLFPQLKASDN